MNYFTNLFKHKHKWETRATNRWQLPTYRECKICGKAQERVNMPYEHERWSDCKIIPEFNESGK